MKSGIELDPMSTRLPGRPPAGAAPKDRTAPAWQREMERAQMEAWLCHSVIGFASPAQQLPSMPADIAATGKWTVPPPRLDASSSSDGVLTTDKTGSTREHRMQEHTRGVTVDRPANRVYRVEGTHIDGPSQSQLAATSVNGSGGDRDPMVVRDRMPALRDSGYQRSILEASSRTEQHISFLPDLRAIAATGAQEHRRAIDVASMPPACATPVAANGSIWSEPAAPPGSPAALSDKVGTLAAPQSAPLPVSHSIATAILSGMPSQRTGQHMCVDHADHATSLPDARVGPAREPIRLHADWSADGLHLWLGMDAPHLGALEFINAQLQRWLSTQGLKLLSMSVNGRVVEQAHQKSDLDVYEAETGRADAAPDAITPTLKEFP